MAVRLTNTSKIIFAISIVLLSALLGFLIWRVNQESQLDPTDSDAGGGGTGCSAAATAACYDSEWCKNNSGFMDCYENGELCGTVACGDAKRCKCCDGNWVTTNSGSCADACEDAGRKGEFGTKACDDTPVVKCVCDSWSNGCGVNCTFPSGTQGQVDAKASGTCKAYIAMCNVNNGSVTIEEYKPGHPCYGKKDECKNPYAEDDCTPANVCDGGEWVTKPTGSIAYETNISFGVKAKDKDGINKSKIVVKLDGVAIPECTSPSATKCFKVTEQATESLITGDLSKTGSKLSTGSHTLTLSWEDKKGATSTACAVSTSFTLLEEETNPDWDISKAVVEQCIDENTEDPKSELLYTITIRNTGDGAGQITKVEDTLDSKVISSFVQLSTITSPGSYADGKILWDYSSSPLTINAGASKVLNYKLVIDKDNFDTYANTVTLTPVDSDAITATANITADCEIAEPEVPQTGLFDTTASRILAGFVLVVFGVVVYNLPNSTFVRKEDFKYREKFERKVANR